MLFLMDLFRFCYFMLDLKIEAVFTVKFTVEMCQEAGLGYAGKVLLKRKQRRLYRYMNGGISESMKMTRILFICHGSI